MGFIPQKKQHSDAGSHGALYFIIKGQKVIVQRSQGSYSFPSGTDLSGCDLDLEKAHFIGYWNKSSCYALECADHVSVPARFEFIPIRVAFTLFSSHAIQAISLAKQILTWDQDFRYCGRCGHPTIELSGERAKICTECDSINYPRLSPSIIVSVARDNQLLLARSEHFPKAMYSVLAGFVEPGETLEECIQREVLEEVGIEVQNIEYFGSQNWPFPHSLMIGFTAEYLRGEISIDNDEIVDAGWFRAQEFPELPGSFSIARHLIDHFCRQVAV